MTLNLQAKTINKTTNSHKRFCFIYVQLSSISNLKEVSLLEPILLDNINNKPHYKLQTENEQLLKFKNIILLSFINVVV